MKGKRIGEWLVFDLAQVFSQKYVISRLEWDSSIEKSISLQYEQERLDWELKEYFGGHVPTGFIVLFDEVEYRKWTRIRTRAFAYINNCKWIGDRKCESQLPEQKAD